MKLRLVVGSVEIRLDGLDLTLPQLKALLNQAGSVALAVDKADDDDDTDSRPIGFTAHMELSHYEEPDLSEWFEESP